MRYAKGYIKYVKYLELTSLVFRLLRVLTTRQLEYKTMVECQYRQSVTSEQLSLNLLKMPGQFDYLGYDS